MQQSHFKAPAAVGREAYRVSAFEQIAGSMPWLQLFGAGPDASNGSKRPAAADL